MSIVSAGMSRVRPVAAALGNALDAAAPAAAKPVPVRLGRGMTAPFDRDAQRALSLLRQGPLLPTGPVEAALRSGRLLHTASDATLDELEHRLRSSPLLPNPTDRLGSARDNFNGSIATGSIRDRLARSKPLDVVIKPMQAQAAQEEFGWKLARAMGIGAYVPAVARRAHGEAVLQRVPGVSLHQAGIGDDARLEQALVAAHRTSTPTLSLSQAAQAGRIDLQLLSTFDYLLANIDRHANNGLWDAAAGVAFIDSGHTGLGASARYGGSQLQPVLKGNLLPIPRSSNQQELATVWLDPATVALLRTRLDSARLLDLHASVFASDAAPVPTVGDPVYAMLQHAASAEFRDGLAMRLEHVLEHRSFSVRPYFRRVQVVDAAAQVTP